MRRMILEYKFTEEGMLSKVGISGEGPLLIISVVSRGDQATKASTANSGKCDQGSNQDESSQQHQGGGAVRGIETEKPGPLFLLVELVLVLSHG